METNMTHGRPMPIILRFTIPLLLGNIFQQFYNMVDSVIVGKYVSPNALAAVGSTGTVMFLIIGLANGMATGFTVLTSQKYGARDADGTKGSFANGVLLSAIVVVVITGLFLGLMNPLLHLMNTPADIYDDAYSYISTITAGTVALVFYNYFAASLRALGNSKTPLYFLIFSALLNIVLDLVFIIYFKLGTMGAALATDVSQGVSAILCLIYIYKKMDALRPERRHYRLDKRYTRKQLEIGIPMALQFGITASGTMVMQTAINVYGSVAVTGFTAASKVQNLMTQGMPSIGQTMAAYAGQNYGYHDMDRVHEGTKDAMILSVIYSIAAGLVCILILPYVIRLFFDSSVDLTAYMPYARVYCYECVVFYIPLAMIFIYRNTMQGCGYGMTAMMLGIVELVARLAAAITSMGVAEYSDTIGYALAAGADSIAWFLGGVAALVLYLRVKKDILRKWEFGHSRVGA